ncbi:hypothetical protein KUW09_14450 [Mameliella alba]|nr:hypothetical protein [Antarctobacter heliothermus]MBY6145253.1 hypothetical protein [Mameliella alba]MCA0955001.1 hypothetical protein [Mameliella alba]
MSDPVTNVEIEDVLSSIRRLVSEEGRPRSESTAAAPDRLVLSPALRVPEVDESAVPPHTDEPATVLPLHGREIPEEAGPVEDALVLGSDTAPAVYAPEVDDWPQTQIAEGHDPDHAEGPETALDAMEDPAAPLSAEVADAEAFLADRASEVSEALPEDPTPEDLAEAEQIAALRASLNDILDPAEATAPQPGLAADYDDWAEDGEPLDLLPEAEVLDDSLEQKIATLEQMLQRQSEDWSPSPEADEPVLADGLADEDADPISGLEEMISAAAEAAAVDMVAQEIEALPNAELPEPEPEFASEPLDAPEPQIGPDSETAQDPDVAPEPDAAPDAETEPKPAFVRHVAPAESLDWEDHAPAPESAEADRLPVAEAEQPTAVAELSEEALQAMVSDIVRRELQGALGERITRNVRKLVRREIHRVLMSQDFD